MTADMTDAREKLDLAMKAAREVIRQLKHLATAPEPTNVNDRDAKKLYTGVMEDLEEFYSEWLHAMQAVGNSEHDRGQSEIITRKDEVIELNAQLQAAWALFEKTNSVGDQTVP